MSITIMKAHAVLENGGRVQRIESSMEAVLDKEGAMIWKLSREHVRVGSASCDGWKEIIDDTPKGFKDCPLYVVASGKLVYDGNGFRDCLLTGAPDFDNFEGYVFKVAGEKVIADRNLAWMNEDDEDDEQELYRSPKGLGVPVVARPVAVRFRKV